MHRFCEGTALNVRGRQERLFVFNQRSPEIDKKSKKCVGEGRAGTQRTKISKGEIALR